MPLLQGLYLDGGTRKRSYGVFLAMVIDVAEGLVYFSTESRFFGY